MQKEWALVQTRERQMEQAALQAKPAEWKAELERKVPDKVYKGLEAAFCKGFALVFQKGRVVIEYGIDREQTQADHDIRDFAIRRKGGARELRAIRRGAKRAELVNLTMTTLEGVGLGALGIGMPDIVLFLGTLLKGIYETALHYGFEYESRREQMLILKMMSAALTTGRAWTFRNGAVEELMQLETPNLSDESFQAQLQETAAVFAVDMLLLKFIQGLPVVGIFGGAANPVYYNKVMKYVQLKYHKRYLRKLMEQEEPKHGSNQAISTGI